MKTKIAFIVIAFATSFVQAQEVYMGQSKNCMPHGFGVIDYSDGSYYQGNFIYGIENGTGTFCDAKGIKSTGLFKDGEFVQDIEVAPNTRLIDFRYHADSNARFESMRVDIQFSEKPNKKRNIIIAPFGEFRLNGQLVSVGFMNNAKGYKDPKHEKKGLYPYEIEHSVFMKTYGERRSQMMMPSPYGFCESGSNDGTNQGEFVSVSRDFEWKKNQNYTLILQNTGYKKFKKNIFTVISLDLIIHKKDTIHIGKLAIPGSELQLEKELSMIASTHTNRYALSEIPLIEFEIKELFINEQPIRFYDAYCSFDYLTPQYALAKLVDEYTSVQVAVGEAFKLISGTFYEDQYQAHFIYNEVFEENE
jgi:hypothetical protein